MAKKMIHTTIPKFHDHCECMVECYGMDVAMITLRLAGLRYKTCGTCNYPLHESHFTISDSGNLSRDCMLCQTRNRRKLKPLTKKERKNAILTGLDPRRTYRPKCKTKTRQRRTRGEIVGTAIAAFQHETKNLAEAMVEQPIQKQHNEGKQQ